MNHTSQQPGLAQTRFRLGDAEIDLLEGWLERGGRRHRLEPRLAGVLDLLARRGLAPVTRDEFLETVWDEDGSDEALNQAISRLRRLLGSPDLIRTLPRLGYCLGESVRASEAGPTRLVLPDWRRWIPLKRLQSPFAGGFVAGVLLTALIASLFWPRTIEREFEILTLEPQDATFLPSDRN
jgi:DNA-binding winged helix-turn-helix (wHTH) protein